MPRIDADTLNLLMQDNQLADPDSDLLLPILWNGCQTNQ